MSVNCRVMSAPLHRFPAPSRLLAHALLTAGVTGAQKVMRRLRGVNPLFSLRSFLETLCEDEARLDKDTHELHRKPLVCLFSYAFKTDLLCFLHLVHYCAPRDSIISLLHCLTQEEKQKPWIQALIHQLHRDIGDEEPGEKSLVSSECVGYLKGLCERFKDPQATGGWKDYLNEHRRELHADDETDSVQKKRKSEVMDLDMETDRNEPETKRLKTDLPDCENNTEGEKVAVDEAASDETALQLYTGPERASTLGQSQEGPLSVLPEHIKVAVPLLKELLESETEWDESCMPTLKILNECDTKQLETLCGILCLTKTPEQTLPHFCSFLLALTPDLSHSAASVIIKNLLLGKVLALTEPASRSLVTAVTSLCSRYPRPTCQALIEPIIREGQTGSAQAELLCQLVKDCFEPHHRLLVFQMTLEGSWNESLLSVIHTLLDLKIELDEGLFSLFTKQLSSQCPNFSKSMKFAKMMLTVLTKFQCHVNATCQNTLSCCISFNETFLKKSLQAALKRITQ